MNRRSCGHDRFRICRRGFCFSDARNTTRADPSAGQSLRVNPCIVVIASVNAENFESGVVSQNQW